MMKIDERLKRILEFISPKKTDKILVIGTGVYPRIEFVLFHKFKCRKIISGDIDERNIKNAQRLLPSLKFINLDAQKKFPFKDRSFDKIIFTEVLEHLKNENFALQEIKRVLKEKGAIIISVPKMRLFKIFSPITLFQHKREYTELSIKKVLEENKFKVNKMFVGGNIFDLFNLWLHLIYKHIFKKLHIEAFFQKQVDKSYEKGFKGPGTDIIIQAGKKH